MNHKGPQHSRWGLHTSRWISAISFWGAMIGDIPRSMALKSTAELAPFQFEIRPVARSGPRGS